MDEDPHPVGAPGAGPNQPVDPGAPGWKPSSLQIRLLKPGGNHGATSKCSDFAHEEAEAQTSDESYTKSHFGTKLYRTGFDSL